MQQDNSLWNKLKQFIKQLPILNNFFIYTKNKFNHHTLSFSQEGEDLFLWRLLATKETSGFYVDIGAHHPQKFSNTYFFYLRGWRGINIDAMPDSMKIFNKIRPQDINLELAISDQKQTLTYYMFNEPAVNGFSQIISKSRNDQGIYKLIDTKKIETYTLAEILDKYLPPNQTIDFMNVDVEGLDYQVLQSNNWQKYRPKIVLTEDLSKAAIADLDKSEMVSFMSQQNYILYGKLVHTILFLRQE